MSDLDDFLESKFSYRHTDGTLYVRVKDIKEWMKGNCETLYCNDNEGVKLMREKQHGNTGNKYALKGESVASKNINIRIQPTLLDAAKQRAKENNVPFSVWLLSVINKELVND